MIRLALLATIAVALFAAVRANACVPCSVSHASSSVARVAKTAAKHHHRGYTPATLKALRRPVDGRRGHYLLRPAP